MWLLRHQTQKHQQRTAESLGLPFCHVYRQEHVHFQQWLTFSLVCPTNFSKVEPETKSSKLSSVAVHQLIWRVVHQVPINQSQIKQTTQLGKFPLNTAANQKSLWHNDMLVLSTYAPKIFPSVIQAQRVTYNKITANYQINCKTSLCALDWNATK